MNITGTALNPAEDDNSRTDCSRIAPKPAWHRRKAVPHLHLDQTLEDQAHQETLQLAKTQEGPVHRSCHGKRRLGKAASHRVARILSAKQGEQLHAYPCSGHWHVGHGIYL